MRRVLIFALPLLASLTLAACGSSSSSSSSSQAATTASSQAAATTSSTGEAVVVKTATSPTLHSAVLVNAQGMTLYHLGGETGGKFICTSAACLQVWHPVSVSAAVTPSGVSALGTVKRPGGALQVTYEGTPLYTFAGDKQSGEDNGQGLKDVGTWTVIKVGEGSSPSASKPAATSSSGSSGSESSGSGGYAY